MCHFSTIVVPQKEGYPFLWICASKGMDLGLGPNFVPVLGHGILQLGHEKIPQPSFGRTKRNIFQREVGTTTYLRSRSSETGRTQAAGAYGSAEQTTGQHQ